MSEQISQHKKLSQSPATAICGNGITSSCLYVSALTIMYSGQYAFIALLIVGLVLYFFRKIYGEAVGSALIQEPVHGFYSGLIPN